MIRFGVVAGVMFFLIAESAALAQAVIQPLPGPPAPLTAPNSSMGGIAPSVYSSDNVGQFLSACGNDQGGCPDEVGNALMDKIVFDGNANICLPGPVYAAPVLDYLKTHPETHSMPTEDGIYMAIREVYPCV